MPKALILSGIRVARPGGSKPPPSLGVRPRLAQKEDEGAFSRSVRVRATKRRRRIFSLWRSHASDRGERSREARVRTERWSRESSAVLRACKRPNVRDVYPPWGEVTPVTEGKEAGRPELALKEVVEGVFCCSESVRAKGLEPIRTKAPDPKSGLATNYNTLAKPFGRLITLSPSLKSAFWKLPTSVSERITKLCIFFKNPKQPASGHSQKQSLT